MDHWILYFESFSTICGTPKSDGQIKSYDFRKIGHPELVAQSSRAQGKTRSSGPVAVSDSGYSNHPPVTALLKQIFAYVSWFHSHSFPHLFKHHFMQEKGAYMLPISIPLHHSIINPSITILRSN